mmetsp:Transcript_14759/g.36658  ORF Transcript_14759/g.36658 Transcript_14759/m.36658 type:complete len:213 (+) Transcript_14759:47-685(+)
MTLRRAASARAAALLLLSASAAVRRPAASASARRVRKASSAVGRIGRPETSGSGGRAGCSVEGSGYARSLMIARMAGSSRLVTRKGFSIMRISRPCCSRMHPCALGRRVARGCEPGVGSASTPSCCSECTIHWPSCRTCTAVWRHRSSYPCRMTAKAAPSACASSVCRCQSFIPLTSAPPAFFLRFASSSRSVHSGCKARMACTVSACAARI